MKIQIVENEDSIVVKVKIPKRKLASESPSVCDLETVKSHLRSEGVEFGEVQQSEFLVLRNTSENSNLTGEWKFAKIKKKTTKARTGNESSPTKRTRTRKPRKSD